MSKEESSSGAAGGAEQGRRCREKAVALQYDDLRELPRVTAAGCGESAKRIVEIAKEYGIPVERNDALAELLGALKPGDAISPESYTLVAEVVSFLYHVDKEWRDRHAFLEPVLGSSEAEE